MVVTGPIPESSVMMPEMTMTVGWFDPGMWMPTITVTMTKVKVLSRT